MTGYLFSLLLYVRLVYLCAVPISLLSIHYSLRYFLLFFVLIFGLLFLFLFE